MTKLGFVERLLEMAKADPTITPEQMRRFEMLVDLARAEAEEVTLIRITSEKDIEAIFGC